MPTKVEVFRPKKNKYKGSSQDLEFMFNMDVAFSIEGLSRTVLTDTGYIVVGPKISAMVVKDPETEAIKRDDIFIIKGKRYLVKAIDDVGELHVVLRFLLEEVK